MSDIIQQYGSVGALSATGIGSLADGGSVTTDALDVSQSGGFGLAVMASFTTGAGAVAGSAIRLFVKPSLDGTTYSTDENDLPIGAILLPSAGAQTVVKIFPIGPALSGRVLPAKIKIRVKQSTGAAITAGSLSYQAMFAKSGVMPETIPSPDAAAWYVATTGSDGAVGTQAAPFLTVQKAVDAASASSTRKTIFLRGGTYRFTNHIYMPAAAANLTIFGYPGEEAIISGGEVVTEFTSEGNGLYSAPVPGGATSLDLVIGGERQRCAQSGTFDPTDPFRSGWLIADPVATGSETTTQFKYRQSDLATVTANAGMLAYVLEGGALRATSVDILKTVTSVNTGTKVVTLSAATSGASPIYNGSNYKLLNHPSFIKNDGEFAWRASDSKLVVRPKSPSFEGQGVVVPRGPLSGHFFQLDNGANNVTFGNLTFANLPHNGAALFLFGATGLRVGGCTFRHVGNGIMITSGNSAMIAGNTFHSIADAGVVLLSNVLGAKVYANTFTDIGLIRKGGAAVYHGGASNSTVAYNDFFGMSRYSVSFKGAASLGHVHHTCRNNYIGRTNRETPDTGAIEFLNRERVAFNALVSSNFIEDAGGFALTNDGTYEDRKYSSCVYLDDLSSFVNITKNFMKGAAWGHVFIHGGDDNTIENNFSIIDDHETLANTMHKNGNLTGDVNPERNKFQKNIYYAATSRVGQMWNLGELGAGNVIDNNVLHNIVKLGANPDPGSTNDVGFDTNSVVADPLFVDPASGDYRLQEASPAFAKGIVNLDWATMGRVGYTQAVDVSEGLPRFWRSWASSPVIDLNYVSRPSRHYIETFARASGGSHFDARGRLTFVTDHALRIDFNRLTMAQRGLLLEPASTNLLSNSSDFTNASWGKTNASASTGGGIGLDGANSLSVLTKTTEQGKANQYVNTFSAGSHLTATVYLKKGASMDWASIELTDNSFVSGKTIWFNLATGVAGTPPSGGTTVTYVGHSIAPMGGGIYKCTLTVLTNTITDATLQIAGDVGNASFWGVVGGTTLLAGAQVEARSSATSLIKTTAGTVSRVADALDIPLAAGSYDILVSDTDGSELRTGQSPTGGLYRVTPRSGKDHVSRIRAYRAGTA